MRKPALRKPSLRKPAVKKPKLPSVEAPQFLEDLYRDLRDRRLLPVVILLVVAIVAVPIVLSAGSSPSTAPPAGLAAGVNGDVSAPEAQSAVLVDAPGLRDYRKRLEVLKSKNPFEQQFEFSGLSETQVESIVKAAETEIATVGGEGEGSTGGASPSVGSSSAETASGGGGEGSSSDSKPSEDETKTEEVTKLVTYRADLRFGPLDDVKALGSVSPLTLLEPVAVFVGISEDGKKALFLVSTDVTNPLGDGSCVPFSGSECGLLVLEVGQEETLEYPLEGSTYKVKLVDVDRVSVK